MCDISRSQSAAVARFFHNYLSFLEKNSIPEKQKRWYVRRLEEFIKAHKGRKIKSLTGADIDRYLEAIGRNSGLLGWQFRQSVHAIRILYCDLFASPLCSEVNWSYWEDSARHLDADHPSTARELTPEELAFFKERRGEGPLQEVRKTHRELLVRFVTEIRQRGYAYRTEQSYEQWVGRYILFCHGRSPEETGPREVKQFLEYLVVRRNVSASTQNQALNALVFLYDQVLGRPLGELESFARAKRPRKLPVVLSQDEVTALLGQLDGVQHLIASLLYGTGMRLLEGLRLRVQDVDFAHQRIHVHQAK